MQVTSDHIHLVPHILCHHKTTAIICPGTGQNHKEGMSVEG